MLPRADFLRDPKAPPSLTPPGLRYQAPCWPRASCYTCHLYSFSSRCSPRKVCKLQGPQIAGTSGATPSPLDLSHLSRRTGAGPCHTLPSPGTLAFTWAAVGVTCGAKTYHSHLPSLTPTAPPTGSLRSSDLPGSFGSEPCPAAPSTPAPPPPFRASLLESGLLGLCAFKPLPSRAWPPAPQTTVRVNSPASNLHCWPVGPKGQLTSSPLWGEGVEGAGRCQTHSNHFLGEEISFS